MKIWYNGKKRGRMNILMILTARDGCFCFEREKLNIRVEYNQVC